LHEKKHINKSPAKPLISIKDCRIEHEKVHILEGSCQKARHTHEKKVLSHQRAYKIRRRRRRFNGDIW
jgi:hypothetical protein